MQQLQLTIQLPASVTESPYEAPEESLRVISNYSSLERMYQKTSPRKIMPHIEMPKKDNFQIAAWDYSPAKEKQLSVKRSRTKFKTFIETKTTQNMTIGSERQHVETRRLKRRSLEPKAEKLMLTTNFKLGSNCFPNSLSKQYRACTPFSSLQPLFKPNPIKNRSNLVQFYHEQNLNKSHRGVWGFNPQNQYITLLQYPIMDEEGLSRRRRNKKEEFFRRFKN